VPTEVKLERVATEDVISVPEVGRVTLVPAVAVRVIEKAPDVVNAPAVLIFPPRVMVFELAIPVPP
jgi:hypothetical protein